MEQGLMDALVGCEIVADAYAFDNMNAVVPFFNSWSFSDSSRDGVEKKTAGSLKEKRLGLFSNH